MIAHLTGPALGRGRFPLARSRARVAGINGETGEIIQTTPELTKRTVVRREQTQEGNKVMRARNGNAKFLQERLQIFLGALLTMKTGGVMRGLAAACEIANGAKVAFGLSHPLARASFHRGLYLWR